MFYPQTLFQYKLFCQDRKKKLQDLTIRRDALQTQSKVKGEWRKNEAWQSLLFPAATQMFPGEPQPDSGWRRYATAALVLFMLHVTFSFPAVFLVVFSSSTVWPSPPDDLVTSDLQIVFKSAIARETSSSIGTAAELKIKKKN